MKVSYLKLIPVLIVCFVSALNCTSACGRCLPGVWGCVDGSSDSGDSMPGNNLPPSQSEHGGSPVRQSVNNRSFDVHSDMVVVASGNLSNAMLNILSKRGWRAQMMGEEPVQGNEQGINLLVVNPSNPLPEDEKRSVRDLFRKGVPVIIDGTEVYDDKYFQEICKYITGVGVSANVLLARIQEDGVPELRAVDVSSPDFEVIADHVELRSVMPANGGLSADLGDLLQSEISDLITELINIGGTKNSFTDRSVGVADLVNSTMSRRLSTPRSLHRPEMTIPLEFRSVIGRCMLPRRWNSGSTYDACDGKLSVSLFYSVDLVRSVPNGQGGDKNSDDSKYIRITLNPKNNGGAGWHLAKSPSHAHPWFESWTRRETRFAPIAMEYGMEIKSNDPELKLFHSIPNNQPMHTKVTDSSGFQVGVTSQASAEVGAQGPAVGASTSASFSYSSNRQVSYDVYEYSVKNLSSAAADGDSARWLWARDWGSVNSWKTRDTDALWGRDWVFDDSKFSNAAYSNFKPGMSATFRVPANKKGPSTLDLINTVEVDALFGEVEYAFWFSNYAVKGAKTLTYTRRKNITVDWGSPFFDPEVPVSLEAYALNSKEGMCLDVWHNSQKVGEDVILWRCHYANNQIWGMDGYQRIRSKVAGDRCMEVTSDNKLKVQSCSASARQKWRWEGDQLISEIGLKLAVVDNLPTLVDPETDVYSKWKNYIRPVKASGILTVR